MCKRCLINLGPELWWTGREIVAAHDLGTDLAVTDDQEMPPS